MPQQLTVAGKIEQRLGLVAMPAVTSGSLAPLLPAGRLLSEDSNLLMYDEEVPAEGARVTRTWQFARGSDGIAAAAPRSEADCVAMYFGDVDGVFRREVNKSQ